MVMVLEPGRFASMLQVEDLRRENKDLLEKVIKACPPPDPKHMPVVDGEALRRTRTTPM